MAKISVFQCDICRIHTSTIFEFEPKLTKKVIVGDKIQTGMVQSGTIYEVCSEEHAIKALRRAGKTLFQQPKITKVNQKKEIPIS